MLVKDTINNNTHDHGYGKEFYNTYYIIDILVHKIEVQINQLNPLHINRNKRGLIDGLGSIIKSITGNLDQSDAEKYEQAINTLSDNQRKLKTIVKDQITLLENSFNKFENITITLNKNQLVINDQIKELQRYVKEAHNQITGTYHFVHFQTILSQITYTFQIIYDTLEKIEIAITFSKLNIFHNSIINPNDLLLEISDINKYLKKNNLPFKPTIENILIFEKLIEIKSYSKGNRITFILEIPIVESEKYNYFHLYSLPTPVKTTYKTIIPQSKYLLLNEQRYALTNKHCKEITQEEYICVDAHTTKIEVDVPCEVQLLLYTPNITNCHQVITEISDLKIQKIEKNQYLVIAPNGIVAVQKCAGNKDNIPLNGTYLIELNNNCEIKIKDVLLKTYQSLQPHFKNIELPKVHFNINTVPKTKLNFKTLQLENINANNGLKTIFNAIENQKEKLDNLSDTPVHFQNISFYTIIIYLIMIFVAIYCLYYVYSKKKKNTRKPAMDPQDIEFTPSEFPSNSGFTP